MQIPTKTSIGSYAKINDICQTILIETGQHIICKQNYACGLCHRNDPDHLQKKKQCYAAMSFLHTSPAGPARLFAKKMNVVQDCPLCNIFAQSDYAKKIQHVSRLIRYIRYMWTMCKICWPYLMPQKKSGFPIMHLCQFVTAEVTQCRWQWQPSIAGCRLFQTLLWT